jgi:preprotein translocase subunit SecE
VVLVTVFRFGFFFFVVDAIFNRALQQVLTRLGGAQ